MNDNQPERQSLKTEYGCIEYQLVNTPAERMEEAKAFLQSEALKSPQEQDVHKQAAEMALCFPEIRLSVNSMPALEIKKVWPLLFKRQHFLEHLERSMNALFARGAAKLQVLCTFLQSTSKEDGVLEWFLKAQQHTQGGLKSALSVALIPMLLSYFKEKMDFVFRVYELSKMGLI
ncbi:uncharacterized protein LOC121047657 [Ixodes scapularis]|uniref:uncharacterized protein LOC121047657 n=1 Tax=Ixodes scapularis TaxID=6945 RepID=UPI001C38C319|nr:uncharacterized protein LOC121047657 [Ixodes scapularis]